MDLRYVLFYLLVLLNWAIFAAAFNIPCDQCDYYCGDVCGDGYSYGTCMILCQFHC